MNKINIAKYQDALESKRKELNDYVTTQVANISFQVPTSIADNRKQSPSKTPKAITAAGIVALLAGLMGNSTALSIVGACATTCGGYLLLKSRKDHDSNVPPSVDYRSLARKTYKQLEAIYSHAISDWDNSLGAQKDTLKNEIQLLQVEAEKKNALMDIAIKRSVISFSMLNIMSTLNNVAKDGNINAFKTCNETFVEQLTSAINLAYREQSKHYADMDSILTAQKQ